MSKSSPASASRTTQGNTKSSSKSHTEYRNPLTSRYASPAMSRVFSEYNRALIWRDLWIYLAEEEKKLGLPISSKQIKSLKDHRDDIDFEKVRKWEKKLKHDVMSHVKAYGEKAKEAEGIIHLGATSCYVTDNADVIILRQASELILSKLALVIQELSGAIKKWKGVVASGFTHFQPAQPVTVGKRLSLWAQDLIWDFEELSLALSRMQPLGCKGATGTQASFMVLFENDFSKVQRLDKALCQRMGFDAAVPVSGQTLSRKVDTWFLNALSNMASSFSKLSHDFRLLQHLGEMREPFGDKQIGSSAMAYKRNPILAERMTSLSRFLMNTAHNGPWTHGTQWLERSLDDSANRRIVLAEAFLCADSLCEIAMRLFSGMEIDKKAIEAFLEKNAEFFETEEAMMRGTLKGESRQDLHEKVRQATMKGKIGKKSGRVIFSGAAEKQVDEFLKTQMASFLKKQASRLKNKKIFGSDEI